MASTKIITKIRTAPPWQITQYDSQAPANSEAVETRSVVILDVIALNKGGSTLYVMLFDATAVPGNGAVPLFQPILVPAGTQVTFSLNDIAGGGTLSGLKTASGLSWAASTTVATLTVDATASVWTTIRYVAG